MEHANRGWRVPALSTGLAVRPDPLFFDPWYSVPYDGSADASRCVTRDGSATERVPVVRLRPSSPPYPPRRHRRTARSGWSSWSAGPTPTRRPRGALRGPARARTPRRWSSPDPDDAGAMFSSADPAADAVPS